jgi:hypothetical protein
MFDPQFDLLSRLVGTCVVELEADPTRTETWDRLHNALKAARETGAELLAAVEAKDVPALRAIVEAWAGGKRPLPEADREVLRRAIKAFRKSLKITRLDAESSVNANAMTSGRSSTIVGIVPPPRYPSEVWRELVREGRLAGGRQGVYELPPGQE